ncbi:Sexual differentiation process protein isp4 [Cytospora mali]|uniref:Sexual differentiation process protein isp4 n=1 Tax=Cytospora mali TaxID=578113 RepID=A0A194VWE3_CYTMA|nr:Sexual differentiation process protein isp4 [Valsa mali]
MPSWFKKAPADPIEVIGDEFDQHSSDDKELPADVKSKVESPPHEELDADQAARKLRVLREHALHDPNLPSENLDAVEGALDANDVEKEIHLVEELIEDSPYPEVRASVRNYDVDLPCNTIRAWVIGMFLTTIFSAINTLFSLRSPAFTVTSIVAQLVSYPIGIGWSKVVSSKERSLFGLKFNLNPGPFNFKEHALIVMMANASYGGGAGYFVYILTVQNKWFGFNWGWGYAILLGLTTQCLGFGLAGLARKWLVEPASMIWPTDLVSCAFMYTLHDHSKTDPAKTNGWSISRYRLFFYIFIGAFCWYWFPGFIFQGLSVFAFPTWIAPNNVNVNKVFGGFSGMGLIPMTFDWTSIASWINSPLVAPWHAIMNVTIGVVVFFWIVAPALHFTNTWYALFLPFFSDGSYDNTQQSYNVTRILKPNFTLDVEAYKNYSPIILPTTFAMCYGLSFAAISCVIVNTVLFNGKEIYQRFKDRDGVMDDVHAKMMKKYKPLPWWWFMCILVPSLALTFVTCYVWETDMTWWSVIIACLISAVWIIPIGMVQAVTNIAIGLNVFTEFLVGYMLPGRPTAMMMFKTYGYIALYQGLEFVTDMKLGHYLKVPPRAMFMCQLVATIWSVVVTVAVYEWALGSISGICTSDAMANFSCPSGEVFYTASVIWGVIGPKRVFSGDAMYASLQYWWLIGGVCPIILWLLLKRWPKSPLRLINLPVIFNGNANIPPATPLNYMAWFVVGFIFNKFIRDRWRGWWMRFNYIVSAGLDSGLAISTIVVVLTLSLTNTEAPNWWGNNGAFNTMDYQGTAISKILKPGETFGPDHW